MTKYFLVIPFCHSVIVLIRTVHYWTAEVQRNNKVFLKVLQFDIYLCTLLKTFTSVTKGTVKNIISVVFYILIFIAQFSL